MRKDFHGHYHISFETLATTTLINTLTYYNYANNQSNPLMHKIGTSIGLPIDPGYY